jgi:hypothetical protein
MTQMREPPGCDSMWGELAEEGSENRPLSFVSSILR